MSGPPTVSGPPSVPAIVQVTAPSGVVAGSPNASFSYRLTQTLELRETAGAGASLESLRIRILRGSAEETQLLGREAILAQIGDLRLNPLSVRSIRLVIDFNTFPADRVLAELSYLGDDGLTRAVSVELHPGPPPPDSH